MGETRLLCGVLGRFAVAGFACACVLIPGPAAAQARGLGGGVVQFEESAGRAILYHEAQGGLLGNAPSAPAQTASPAPKDTPRSNGTTAAAAPKKTTTAKAPRAGTAENQDGVTPPLRAPQRKAAPAEGVAMRPQ